jgi:5-methylcytosine-specific restriction protein A
MPYAAPRHCSAQPGSVKTHAHRGSPHARGYTKRWCRVRRSYLQAHPLCADPFGTHRGRPVPGEVVDHIVPLSRGGTHDESNLQTLCASCHSRKTVQCDGGFGHPTGPGSGMFGGSSGYHGPPAHEKSPVLP